jgi:myo-inositol-1(or 4)-monophosphatase
MKYEQLGRQVSQIARATGEFIRNERLSISAADVETKSAASFVTYVDKTAEQMIVDELRKLLPSAGYVTEEGTAGRNGENLVWVIDPLDGTTNYIHGLNPVSVSIGLLERVPRCWEWSTKSGRMNFFLPGKMDRLF